MPVTIPGHPSGVCYGEVLSQTPEVVRLQTIPGSVVTYQTSAFLGLAPNNHSQLFGLRITVGLDYGHQKDSTSSIREKLEAFIRNGLELEVGPDHLKACWVEFASAGASSLDFTVGADFAGEVAHRRAALTRSIQRLFVEACNKHDWVIPFTQLTVHQAA